MSDEVENMMYNNNGEYKLPWHGKGEPVEGLATAEEAIEKGGLDWEVEKRQVSVEGIGDVPDTFATVRTDTYEPLGIVGNKYTPLQNKDAFKFFDSIVGEGNAVYETAGALSGGKRVWLLAKLPGHIRVLNDDITDKYLLLSNGHDGVSVVQALFTPVRVVCNNTLNAALRNMKNMISVRHTSTVDSQLERAGEIIRKQEVYFDLMQQSMEAMTKVSFDESRTVDYFERVFEKGKYAKKKVDPESGEEEKQSKWRGLDTLKDLAENGAGTDIAGVRGSLYGAFQAVTEYVDHGRNYRGKTDRMEACIYGNGAGIKRDAMKVAMNMLS